MKENEIIQFLIACERGDLETAKLHILNHGGIPETSNIDAGYTPLMRACGYYCKPDLIYYLVKHGADIETIDPEFGHTAISVASESKNIEAIDALIDLGCNIDHQDFEGQTALMHSIIGNYLESVIRLIEKGASIELTDSNGRNARKIAESMEYDAIIQYFVDKNI